MGELYLIFVGTIIVNIMAVALMFVKNGKFVSNNMISYICGNYYCKYNGSSIDVRKKWKVC